MSLKPEKGEDKYAEGEAILKYMEKQVKEMYASQDIIATGELWAEYSKDFDDDTLRLFGVDPANRLVSIAYKE